MRSCPDTDIDLRVSWLSISVHVCDPVPNSYAGALL